MELAAGLPPVGQYAAESPACKALTALHEDQAAAADAWAGFALGLLDVDPQLKVLLQQLRDLAATYSMYKNTQGAVIKGAIFETTLSGIKEKIDKLTTLKEGLEAK